MAVDILLSNSYFLNKDAAEQRAMRPYPPLGLLYLSAYLKQHGYCVQVFDNTFRPDELDFAQTLQETDARVVGFHATVICRQMISRLIRLAKEMGRTVIAGGPDPSISPEDYLAMGADYVVIGEGEYALKELMDMLTGRSLTPVETIAGVVFSGPDKPVRTPPRPLSKDVDSLPFPDREAIDVQTYARPWRERHGVFAVHRCRNQSAGVGHRRGFRRREYPVRRPEPPHLRRRRRPQPAGGDRSCGKQGR